MTESTTPPGEPARSVDATSTGHLRATVGSLGGSGTDSVREAREQAENADGPPTEKLEPLPTETPPADDDRDSRRVRSRRRSGGIRWPRECPKCEYEIAMLPDRACPECGLASVEIIRIAYWRRARTDAWFLLAVALVFVVGSSMVPILVNDRPWIPAAIAILVGLLGCGLPSLLIAMRGPQTIVGSVLTAWLRLLPLLILPLVVSALGVAALAWTDAEDVFGRQRWLTLRVATLVVTAVIGFAMFAIRWTHLNDRHWIDSAGDEIATLAFVALLGSVGAGWAMLMLPPFG